MSAATAAAAASGIQSTAGAIPMRNEKGKQRSLILTRNCL